MYIGIDIGGTKCAVIKGDLPGKCLAIRADCDGLPIKEETGLEANNWLHLCDTFTTPGFSNEKISLYLARDLISGERQPAREELEFALHRIESIIHKSSKARDKYEVGSRNYNRFDPTVQTMERVRSAIVQALEK